MNDLGIILQRLANPEHHLLIGELRGFEQKLVRRFEESIWKFDEDEYDALYQVVLAPEEQFNPQENGNLDDKHYPTTKFVAWKDDVGESEIQGEYPDLMGALRYDADKIREMKERIQGMTPVRPVTYKEKQ